jgi:hypothetical protein
MKNKRVGVSAEVFLTILTVALLGSLEPTNPRIAAAAVSKSLTSSVDPRLRKLGNYQTKLGQNFGRQMMVFSEMPSNPANAVIRANYIAQSTKEYSKYGIKPLFILEPRINGGQYFDLSRIASGDFDYDLRAFFGTIKSKGVTSAQMGTWVMLPEPNIPEWGINAQTNPEIFTLNYNHLTRLIRQYFPDVQLSIMLNSQTYKPGDTGWANPSYASLTPYTKNIDKKLVNSFGLQGFPWSKPANLGGETYANPEQFLNPNLAMQAARSLNTKKLWFNSGTYRAIHTNHKNKTVLLHAAERQKILNSILTQVKTVRKAGFNTTVNIFAEDKSRSDEAADWSYLKTPETLLILKHFISQCRAHDINVSLYDA